MGSVNRVILVGHLGADPDLKYTQSNRPVCNLSVATNEAWKDKAGQKQEKTEWHRVQVWGDQAENCQKFLAKGRMVYIEGRLQTRKWEDKSGAARYTTEVVADRVVFLGGGDGTGASGGQSSGRRWGEQQEMPGTADAGKHHEIKASDPPPPGYGDDDIPF
jgi:single-strand DNA-binding protein